MNRRLDRLEHLGTLSDAELEQVAQVVASGHLTACYEYMVDAADGLAQDRVDPATSPFCACHDCIVREVTRAIWPVLQELARRDYANRDDD